MSHAHLYVLAYLLMRVAGELDGESWPLIRKNVKWVSAGPVQTDYEATFRVTLTAAF